MCVQRLIGLMLSCFFHTWLLSSWDTFGFHSYPEFKMEVSLTADGAVAS